MPPRSNGPRGGNFGNRNDNMRRGGSGGRGRFDRGNRNYNQGGGFKRRDSEDFQRRSTDDFPNRGGFSRRPPGSGQNSKYKDQSDKKKTFWRETPDGNKKKKPSRDTKQSFNDFPKRNVPKPGAKKVKPKKDDSDSEYMTEDNELSDDAFGSFNDFPKRNVPKPGAKKVKPKKDNSDSEYMTQDNELPDDAFGSDFSSSEENEDEGSEMEQTGDEMQKEVLERDYKEFMTSQKKGRIVKLRDDKDYKSSDESSVTDSDSEQYSAINSDDLREPEGDSYPKELYKMFNKHPLRKDERPKLSKPKLDENKSSGRATITEPEWNDFLQKNVYESPVQEKPNIPIENESKESIPIEEEQVEESISNKEEETPENIVEALKDKWKWFHKLTKTISDEKIILPKELPDEIDDERMEKGEDVNEGKEKSDKEMNEKTFEELFDAEKVLSKISDAQFQQLKQLYVDSLSAFTQPSNVQASPAHILEPKLMPSVVETSSLSEQTVESESKLSSVKTIEGGTDSSNMKAPVAETSLDSKKPNELSKISQDDAESDGETKVKYIAPKFTDDVERLRDTWHRFILCYEQSTGDLDHNLPYDLPNEEDEHDDFQCEDEPESDVAPKLEPAHPPVSEKPGAAALVPKDDVSGTLTRVESSDGKQRPSTPEESDDFDGDPGFKEMFDKAEDERDKDLNRQMYEAYKITGSPEEFLEDYPEIRQLKPENFPPKRPVLQWHHFKELWNRFVDNITSYPGKAFEEFDKIIAAKDRAIEKGTDIAKELNLTSVPEKEEPLTEYQKTEAELRAAWKKYEKEAAIDPQRGVFETLVEEGELHPNPDDIISPEAEQTLRAVVSLLDHPERFDMKKYKASLSKEEIESVENGEAMKYHKMYNPNEISATSENDTTVAQTQENSFTQNEPTQGNSKRSAMAQKMWEYFVNMMRQRHEKELEKFLNQQPQGSVPIGDNPDEVKGLWQKYINYTNSLQPSSNGKSEEFEYLLASTSNHQPHPLNEESKTNVAKTQGWNNLIEELDGLQERLRKPQIESTMPVTGEPYDRRPESVREPYLQHFSQQPDQTMPETTARRGWDVLSERMKNLSAYKNGERKNTQTLFEVADKKKMEYFYRQQFGVEGSQDHQEQEPNTENQSSEGISPPENRPAPPPHVAGNYSYGAYPRERELTPQYQTLYPWQYGTEVNQMSSTPFGQNRQPHNYDENSEQYAAGSGQTPWLRTNPYNRGYDPNIPRGPQINRSFLYQEDPTPLNNQASKTPLYQQRRPFANKAYSQQIPGQNEMPWSSAQEHEPLKSTKNWQSGSRPFMQQQDESFVSRTPSGAGEYSRPVGNHYYQHSRGLYDMKSKDENCIHLTHQDGVSNHNLQTT